MNEELWIDTRGVGPDVLLVAGLSDPAEAWTEQLEGLSGSMSSLRFNASGG